MTYRRLSVTTAAALALSAFALGPAALAADQSAETKENLQAQPTEALPESPVDDVVKYDNAEGAASVVLDDPDDAAAELEGAMSPTGPVEAEPDVEELAKKKLLQSATPGEEGDALPVSPVDNVVEYDDAEGASDVVVDDPDRATEQVEGAMSPTGPVDEQAD